ncbi:helix-turn-helix transcriptional regulator [Thermopolyspora sp. NPDC052614]|uniref:helix-turn-helix domain-containing protein n=1 Tax=Thermopolyspora sp. NPDC052614 TaxID=3155682 RepID=UPI003433D255
MNEVPSLDPGSPRVRFGAEMRRLREAAELSQAAIAARLGCTQTQVSRLEKATRTPSRSDAEKLDQFFGTDNRVSFVRLHQRIIARPGNPKWFQSWVDEVEPTALVLRSWDPLLFPGLLQTEAYARHIFRAEPGISDPEVEECVEARMRRQRILDRDNPPLVYVMFDANVLRRCVGGPEVMREQLSHLQEAAARPAISLQLVDPECLTGMVGSIYIAELPDGQPDVVHSDSPTLGQTTMDYDIVGSVWRRYETIRLWAYPERVSLKMIEEARREWT